MIEIISTKQIEELRQEFKEYLMEKHPEWSDSTISLHYSDSFYAYNNNVVNFSLCFSSDEAMLLARDKIRDHLLTERNSDRAEERANEYLASMKHFKSFLDDRYPALADD